MVYLEIIVKILLSKSEHSQFIHKLDNLYQSYKKVLLTSLQPQSLTGVLAQCAPFYREKLRVVTICILSFLNIEFFWLIICTNVIKLYGLKSTFKIIKIINYFVDTLA